jgi:predicted RNA-binding Zn-ribbon protein involved in translation (DUF1610 family)
MTTERFIDKNFRLSDFENEVWVVCPSCYKQAISTINETEKKARLFCTHCGFNKTCSTQIAYEKRKILIVQQAAYLFFDAKIWFSMPYKKYLFWAYNPSHLNYLEQYIGAKLRENKGRTHFTLLEKLPKFYHEAKNREGLLKIISILKMK